MFICILFVLAISIRSKASFSEPFGILSMLSSDATADTTDLTSSVLQESGQFDSSGTFRLRDASLGKCISVNADKTSVDSITSDACDIANTFQNMKLDPTSGHFKLHNLSRDKCIYHNSKEKLGIDDCENVFPDQAWQISQGADSTTQLVNLQTGKCLTAAQAAAMSMQTCDDKNLAQRYHLDKQLL